MFKSEKCNGAYSGSCVSDFCGDEVCVFSGIESGQRECIGQAFADAKTLVLQEVFHG